MLILIIPFLPIFFFSFLFKYAYNLNIYLECSNPLLFGFIDA